MKKLILLLAAAAMLASCGPKANYTVVGRPLPGSRAKGAHLVEYLVDTLVRSKCIIGEGAFNIKGHVDEPIFVRCVQNDGFSEWAFVLEPGVIYLSDTDNSASGTPLNDAVVEVQNKLRNVYYLAREDQDPDALAREIVTDFCKTHGNDIAGAYILCGAYTIFSPDELKAILASAGPVFLESEFIAFMKKSVKALND